MAPLGESTCGCLPSLHLVALHPGAEIALGDVVLLGAGAHAVAAADALVDIDDHAPPVVGHLVGFAGGRGAGDLLERGAHGRQNEQLAAYLEQISPADIHDSSSSELAGCGADGTSRTSRRRSARRWPPAGRSAGLAASFSWQRRQRLATSGSLRDVGHRVVGVFAPVGRGRLRRLRGRACRQREPCPRHRGTARRYPGRRRQWGVRERHPAPPAGSARTGRRPWESPLHGRSGKCPARPTQPAPGRTR